LSRSATRSLAQTTALVLVGGLGTRLRSVVADRPKVLAEVAGRPFVAHLLDLLDTAGCRHVVLCTGYLGDQVEAALGVEYGGLTLAYSQESEPLGTGGAVRLACEIVASEELLVVNGDSYCAANLERFAAWHRTGQASLLLTPVSDTARYGRVVLGEDDRIARFEEKAAVGGPGWINAGIYLLSRHLMDAIPRGLPCSLERDLFPEWLRQGLLFGFRAEADFIDIGVPSDYARAEAFLANMERPAA
jgi:D-glycero-alpha-D-manno-heptose 1-phosphate guanylyltransferase